MNKCLSEVPKSQVSRYKYGWNCIVKMWWLIKHLNYGHSELIRSMSVKIYTGFPRWSTKKRIQKCH